MLVVRVNNQEDDYNYDWNTEKFENRLGLIRELIENFNENQVIPNVGRDKDPFWDPPAAKLLGSVETDMSEFIKLQDIKKDRKKYEIIN
jgi:kinesin family protein 1